MAPPKKSAPKGLPTDPSALEDLEREYQAARVIRIEVGQEWEDMNVAKDAIKRYLLDRAESWGKIQSDPNRLLLSCKVNSCPFKITLRLSKKSGKARLNKYTPHTCSPITHEGHKTRNSVKYLAHHHQKSIAKEVAISSKSIRNVEDIFFGHKALNRRQALRVKQHVQSKLHGDEHAQFSLLPAYLERLKEADPDTYTHFKVDSNTGAFLARIILYNCFPKDVRNWSETIPTGPLTVR